MRSERRDGFLYVHANNIGHRKVGKAVDLSDRATKCDPASPFPGDLEMTAWSFDRHELESAVKLDLAEYRANGEWFLVSGEVVSQSILKCMVSMRDTSTWRDLPIIRKLGGKSSVKKILAQNGIQITDRSLNRWFTDGYVSGRHYALLMREADRLGITYTAEDFAPLKRSLTLAEAA